MLHPTQSELKSALDYNPETGIFTRKLSVRGRPAGAVVGSNDGHGYLRAIIFGRNHAMHRLAWLYVTGEWPEFGLDHINRVKDDNRFANLRLANQSQNMANMDRPRNNTSGFKGVYFHKQNQKWAADIQFDGRKKFLGLFDTIEEARAAYAAAARLLFGEFAYLGQQSQAVNDTESSLSACN